MHVLLLLLFKIPIGDRVACLMQDALLFMVSQIRFFKQQICIRILKVVHKIETFFSNIGTIRTKVCILKEKSILNCLKKCICQ